MSKRAEEAALKAIPVEDNRSIFGFSLESAYTIQRREGFQQGYEQAEKETIEKALDWLKYAQKNKMSFDAAIDYFKAIMEEK